MELRVMQDQKKNHGLKNTTMKNAIRKSMLKDINNKTKVEARQKKKS